MLLPGASPAPMTSPAPRRQVGEEKAPRKGSRQSIRNGGTGSPLALEGSSQCVMTTVGSRSIRQARAPACDRVNQHRGSDRSPPIRYHCFMAASDPCLARIEAVNKSRGGGGTVTQGARRLQSVSHGPAGTDRKAPADRLRGHDEGALLVLAPVLAGRRRHGGPRAPARTGPRRNRQKRDLLDMDVR